MVSLRRARAADKRETPVAAIDLDGLDIEQLTDLLCKAQTEIVARGAEPHPGTSTRSRPGTR